jgi:antitoxin VapB
MSLNIKSPEAHELAAELARLMGESMTKAVTEAIRERLERKQRDRDRERMVAEAMAIARRVARVSRKDRRPLANFSTTSAASRADGRRPIRDFQSTGRDRAKPSNCATRVACRVRRRRWRCYGRAVSAIPYEPTAPVFSLMPCGGDQTVETMQANPQISCELFAPRICFFVDYASSPDKNHAANARVNVNQTKTILISRPRSVVYVVS